MNLDKYSKGAYSTYLTCIKLGPTGSPLTIIPPGEKHLLLLILQLNTALYLTPAATYDSCMSRVLRFVDNQRISDPGCQPAPVEREAQGRSLLLMVPVEEIGEQQRRQHKSGILGALFFPAQVPQATNPTESGLQALPVGPRV